MTNRLTVRKNRNQVPQDQTVRWDIRGLRAQLSSKLTSQIPVKVKQRFWKDDKHRTENKVESYLVLTKASTSFCKMAIPNYWIILSRHNPSNSTKRKGLMDKPWA